MQPERRLRILYLYRDMIPSIRLCGHSQLMYLSGKGMLEYRHSRVAQLKKADLSWADAVLLGRLDNWYECQIAKQLRAAGKFLIYVMDDDLLHVPLELSSGWYYSQSLIHRSIREMIHLSHAILSPSPLLLQCYAGDGRVPIRIEEPALEPVEYKAHSSDQPVRIGFAGSVDRTKDIESMLCEALCRIRQERGSQVQFEFFGAVPAFASKVDARTIPYCDSYDEYRQILNRLEWDIGLAPMPETAFHSCKHYNKFIEYAAAGIAGVFSKVPPYDRLAAQNTEALFCENTAEGWTNAICWLLDHPQQREAMRAALCKRTRNELGIEAISSTLFDILRSTVPLPDETSYRWCLFPFRLIGDIQKAIRAVRRDGWRTPLILIQKLSRSLHKSS